MMHASAMDHTPDDALSPRLIAPHFRRLVKARNFGLATNWLRRTARTRIVRTKDSLEVEFERGPVVSMRASGAALAIACSCGRGLRTCRHMAAAALAWIEKETPPGGPWGLWRAVRTEDFRKRFAGTESIQSTAFTGETPDGAAARLLRLEVLRRARLAPGGPDLGLMRVALEQTCTPGALRDAGSTPVFLQGLNPIFEELLQFSRTGVPETAIPLLEYAIEPFRDLTGLLPGDFHSVSMSLVNIMGFHVIACRRARPDPIRIARWLGVSYPFGDRVIPPRMLAPYEGLLGASGIAEAKRVHAMVRVRTDLNQAPGLGEE